MIKKLFLEFTKRLYKIDNKEELNPGSIFVIVLLDIFVLVILFVGLANQTNLLTRPSEYIPDYCYNIIIEKGWIKENRLDKLQEMTLDKYRYGNIDEKKKVKMNSICLKINNLLSNIKEDKKIIENFELREKLVKIKEKIYDEYNQSKSEYDTYLLEKITNPDIDIKIIKDNYDKKIIQLNNIDIEIQKVDNQINSNKNISDLWNIIDESQLNYTDKLLAEYKSKKFYFPIIELLFQSLFLIPLFIFFCLWSIFSLKRNKKLQVIISTHLLIVVSIPIFFKIISTVVDIFPKTIFKVIFDFLVSIKIIAIWYYILIILGILITIFIIYKIQKHTKKYITVKPNPMLSRFTSGLCIKCGKKIKENDKYCIYCGENQYKKCLNCGENTYFISDYCCNCGVKIQINSN